MPGPKASEAERREQILKAAYEVALRAGIDGLTVRAVAARAKLSHGLVLFHFGRKERLVSAVLDRVLAATTMLQMTEEIARIPRAPDRLRALLQHELERLAREPRRLQVFFEYVALGTRHPATRVKVSAALDRYRAAFRAMTEEVLRTAPGRIPDVTPEGLAAVAVSFINGGAVQAVIDPDRFDVESYLAAGYALIGRLAPAAD
jgi:AcrR family transcriptional regulator